ncbi:hypothetical protein Hanom_Chr07g00583091 [Helianthus anomalus]
MGLRIPTVAALTVASRHVGHHEGYAECASHVEATLKGKWDTQHCLVNAKAEKGFNQAEENYNTLSLPVMDLVSNALRHDDYVTRLKAIFNVPEAQELSDNEDEDVGDGSAK